MTTAVAVPVDSTCSAAQRARFAALLVFFIQGAVFATWVSRIPVVQERLGLSNSVLGMALLAISAAGMVAMPVMGQVVARVGSRAAVRVGVMVYCLMLVLPGMAGSFWALAGSLAAFGTLFGAMNVAINSQAVVVEKAYGRPIMAGFHALFSLGGMAGAAMGAAMAALGVGVLAHFLMVAAVMGTLGALAAPMMLADPPQEESRGEGGSRWAAFVHPHLVLLGAVTFCVLVGEGAMGDWTAVYLHRALGTGMGFAAAGYAVFSLAMTGGRLVADRVTAAIGPVRFVRYGAGLAACGLAAGLVSHVAVVAMLGFACAGVGFSGICPILFSAGGRTDGVAPSAGIATVATMGFVGFLIGPPVIWVVADWVG
ncbi:MAG: MFS transporter [Phycisphaerae bacterium]